jgi:8-oxo-dGTP pyrophosphatase MutT (NUDIX family)
MHNPFVAAVEVFIFRGERILAMRRARDSEAAAGAWDALSGRVHPGEQPLDAARREAREESGLEIHLEPRPVTSYVAKRNEDDMMVVAYRAESEAGEVILSHEHDEFAWMTIEEFTTACRFPILVEAARLALKTRGAPPGRMRTSSHETEGSKT